MSLDKKWFRDGSRKIIGSTTTGYTGSFETLVRDEHEHIIGRTSEKFGTTRDEHGKLVSINTADAGLLMARTRSSGICYPNLPPFSSTLLEAI